MQAIIDSGSLQHLVVITKTFRETRSVQNEADDDDDDDSNRASALKKRKKQKQKGKSSAVGNNAQPACYYNAEEEIFAQVCVASIRIHTTHLTMDKQILVCHRAV